MRSEWTEKWTNEAIDGDDDNDSNDTESEAKTRLHNHFQIGWLAVQIMLPD